MRWIISEPTHNHAPRYGSLSSGRASFISRPESGNSEQNATIESTSDVYVCKWRAYRAGCDNNQVTSRDSHRVFQHGEQRELQYLHHKFPLINNNCKREGHLVVSAEACREHGVDPSRHFRQKARIIMNLLFWTHVRISQNISQVWPYPINETLRIKLDNSAKL